MSAHVSAEPVPGKFLTRGSCILLGFAAVGVAIALYRFLFGLSAASNLSDAYPWGLWIAVDVASGVALAAGGFTTAALAHIFHRQHYEALVRPALLTAMLGYTFVALGLMVDLGRYYNIWHPLMPSMWQGNSVLFEVAMCVVFYLNVLYIEFLPAVCERFRGRVDLPGLLARLNGPTETVLKIADLTLARFISLFIIAGVVLSCMHQSSLGTLMVIAPSKMHALWYTPFLPLFFLMSAMMVGFPMVIFESLLVSWSFGRKPEMELLAPLSRFVVFFTGIYFIAKSFDLATRGALPLLFDGSFASLMFAAEMGLGVLLPFLLLLSARVRTSPLLLFSSASLVVGGVALNRINVFLVAYQPGRTGPVYIPSLMEILVTVGLISTLMLVYRAAVMIFPVLPRPHSAETAGAAGKGKRHRSKAMRQAAGKAEFVK